MTITPRKFSQQQDGGRSPRYTPLERAVMTALVHDLRGQIPDLAGQFEASRAGQRRNSGFGLFTEMFVNTSRPSPSSGPSGDLGSVHAMVGHLPHPIAFRVRVRNGVLLGLLGDSYGQDTRAIDFATVPFDQVFTVDVHGRSIPFEPVNLAAASPGAPHTSRQPGPAASALPGAAPLGNRPVSKSAPERISPVEPTLGRKTATANPPPGTVAAAKPEDALIDSFLGASSDDRPMTGPERLTLRAGLWLALFVLATVLILVFRAPFVFVFVAAVLAGRFLQTTRGLLLVRRGMQALKTSR